MKRAQPFMISWLMILIGLMSVFSGCTAKSPGTAMESQVQLNKIEPREADGKVEITIEGTAPIKQYTSFQLPEPLRLVVEITDANIGSFQDKIPVNLGAVTDIMPSQKENIARLEIALTEAVDSKVYQADGKLMVELAKSGETTTTSTTSPEAITPAPAPAPETAKQEQVEAPAPQPEQAMAKVVSAVRASAGKDGVRVVISGDGAMSPKTFMLKDNRLVVDIPGAKSKVRPSVIPVRKGGLARVRVAQHEDKVRVVMDLTKPLAYTVTPEGNSLVVAMNAAGAALPAATPGEAAPQERAAQEPGKSAAAGAETEVVPPQAPAEAAAAPVAAEKKERAEPSKREPGSPEEALTGNIHKFKGRKISLDLQDADLINVLRLFAEVANLNIILAPEVRGKVTVRMVNIPWDQAMEIILKMNGLGFVLEDNILRIASVQSLTKEAEEDTRSKEAKKKSEDLVTRIIPVNYSTAGTVESTIKKSLSPRGDVMTDVRTNTLIVKDIQKNVDEVAALIKLLDKPIPQIMIEARIVEASLNFNRTIGVQWGGTFKADAAHGNATGLQFPNTIGVTGGPNMGATPSGNGNFLVNMPAPAGAGTGGGAIGFTFGSLSKALNLDLVLSALESTGEGKVISTPRISALDNKEAKIEQGVSIPFSTASASGTAIQFIDAKLSLVVTPHATPDNKIFLKIQATKNAPDTSLLGASGQPSIQKNEATTEILLSDGETAVIGGVLIIDQGVTDTKVPFFGDLPLIGWLFKSRARNESKRELLIFITPRIMVQEVI